MKELESALLKSQDSMTRVKLNWIRNGRSCMEGLKSGVLSYIPYRVLLQVMILTYLTGLLEQGIG